MATAGDVVARLEADGFEEEIEGGAASLSADGERLTKAPARFRAPAWSSRSCSAFCQIVMPSLHRRLRDPPPLVRIAYFSGNLDIYSTGRPLASTPTSSTCRERDGRRSLAARRDRRLDRGRWRASDITVGSFCLDAAARRRAKTLNAQTSLSATRPRRPQRIALRSRSSTLLRDDGARWNDAFVDKECVARTR